MASSTKVIENPISERALIQRLIYSAKGEVPREIDVDGEVVSFFDYLERDSLESLFVKRWYWTLCGRSHEDIFPGPLPSPRGVLTLDEYCKCIVLAPRYFVGYTLLYNGRELHYQQAMCEVADPLRRMLLKRHWLSLPFQPRVPEIVPYCFKDFRFYRAPSAVQPEFWAGGRLYALGDAATVSLEAEHIEHLRDRHKGFFGYALYAGSYYYKPLDRAYVEASSLVDKVDGIVGDVEVQLYSVPYEAGMLRNSMLDCVFPCPSINLSYVDLSTYNTPNYSRWSELHHGPTASQLLHVWSGSVTVPADGAGLFASRCDGREGVFGDLMVSKWTHSRVVKESITDTLRRSIPGSLQVFFFCSAFMTPADYALVRHPYVFIDKYPPSMPVTFRGRGIYSSFPVDVEVPAEVQYGNPAYSENLLRLGDVDFESENLHSYYAELLGVRRKGGILVNQTWADFVRNPDRYFCMVGMTPLVQEWNPNDRHYARIVYRSGYHPPKGCSYHYTGTHWYFYFPGPCQLQYPDIDVVHPFPDLDPRDYLGKARNALPVHFSLWPIIETMWADRGILNLGVYVDFSMHRDLAPYWKLLLVWCPIPEKIAAPYVAKGIIERNGDQYRYNRSVCTSRVRYVVVKKGGPPIYEGYYFFPKRGKNNSRLLLQFLKTSYGDGKLVRNHAGFTFEVG